MRRLLLAVLALACLAPPASASPRLDYGFFTVSATMTYTGSWSSDEPGCGADPVSPHGSGTQSATFATAKPVKAVVFGLNGGTLTVSRARDTLSQTFAVAARGTQTAVPAPGCEAVDGPAYAGCTHTDVPFPARLSIGIERRLSTAVVRAPGFAERFACPFDANRVMFSSMDRARAEGQRVPRAALAKAKIGRPITFTARSTVSRPADIGGVGTGTTESSVTFTLRCRPKDLITDCPKRLR